ncbi:MAG: pyridoxine 5'-phosphate synthase [Cyclobacteriaceae bacterium]|nr:pyridoxine 5'-phosphate synthase [Cyclobacteriaceae bacterium]
MTKLSVNINKFATLRNARGGNNPNVVQAAVDCQRFGAQGITVHPRPDERHITYQDVLDIMPVITTEYNIEGYPDARYLELISRVKPTQATLVPDGPDVITSNAGWDTINNREFLEEIIGELKRLGIRSSIFIDPVPERIEKAAEIGCDRIELYTEGYARAFQHDAQKAIEPYRSAALLAHELGLEINAGHDLDMNNLKYFKHNIPFLAEVSIGHAIVCDALYFGLENTVQLYLRQLIEENAIS